MGSVAYISQLWIATIRHRIHHLKAENMYYWVRYNLERPFKNYKRTFEKCKFMGF